MAKAKKSFTPVKISGDNKSVSFDIISLFETIPTHDQSPIDVYIKRSKSILVKLGELERSRTLDTALPDDLFIYNLFLLGFISNVESYFRGILRKVIIIDRYAYDTCLESPVTYAAALHHKTELLPEALMEGSTFINSTNIIDTTKKLTGILINKQEDDEVIQCLKQFENLCELRHCVVHRAGLLGSKNAIKLGIDEYKSRLEHPFFLKPNALQVAAVISLNCVRSFNNFLFNKLIIRFIESDNTKSTVSWNLVSDKKWFKLYFDLFYSHELVSELPEEKRDDYQLKTVYNKFRNQKK